MGAGVVRPEANKYTPRVLRVAVLTGQDWEERLGDAWNELCNADPDATPFQSQAWTSLWWKHFGRGKTPFVMSAYEGDDLVALYPLFRQGSLWGAIRPMGVGPSDYLKPIARPDYRDRVWEHFLARLGEEPSLVDLHQVPSEGALIDVHASAIVQATCLVVDLPTTYDTYVERLSKSLRYDVRRLSRDARARVNDAVEPVDAMRVLFDLHEKRWRSRGLPGTFLGRTRRFQEEWAAVGARAGLLRVSILEFDGRAVGAIYAMRMGHTTYYYQAGFDPEAGSISPGTMLVAHALNQAIAEGSQRFDFCRGDEPYKRRWKPDRIVTNYRVLLGAPGLGRVGESWNRLAWSVEERIRRRLEGGRLLPRRGPHTSEQA